MLMFYAPTNRKVGHIATADIGALIPLLTGWTGIDANWVNVPLAVVAAKLLFQVMAYRVEKAAIIQLAK